MSASAFDMSSLLDDFAGESTATAASTPLSPPAATSESAASRGVGIDRRLYSVRVVEPHEDVCGGLIGEQGGTICFVPAGECSVRLHENPRKKWGGDISSLLMVQRSPTVMFASPAIEASLLRDDLTAHFMQSEKTIAEWSRLFRYVRNLAPPASKAALIEREEESLSASASLNTPFVLRRQEEDDSSFVHVDEYSKTDQSDIEPGQRIDQVEGFLVTYPSQVSSVMESIQRDVSASLTGLKVVRTKLEDLVNAIGERDNTIVPTDFDLASLWEVVGEIAQAASLNGSSMSTADCVKLVKTEINAWKSQVNGSLVGHDDVQAVIDAVSKQFKSERTYIDQLFLPLKQAVDSFNNSGSSFLSLAGLGSAPKNFAPSSIQDLIQRVTDLETELTTLKGDKDSSVVKFAHLGFKEPKDAVAFVVLHVMAKKFGLVFDICTFLEHVLVEIDGQKDQLRKMETVTKLKLSSTNDIMSICAYASPVPGLFSEIGHGTCAANEPAFSKFKTFKKWKDSQETLKRAMTSVKAGMIRSIDGDVPINSTAHTAMRLSVAESYSTMLAFMNYLTDTQEDLENSGLPTAKAWLLTTRLGDVFFRTMGQARTGIAHMLDTTDVEKLSGLIWCSVGQTHDVMKEFVDLEFKGHPAISGAHIKFFVQNNNRDEASTFSDKCKELEDKLKQANKEIVTAKQTADNAHNLAKNLTAGKGKSLLDDMEKIKKRVKAVEDNN